MLVVKHDELTAEEFIYMWESVWGAGPSLEQTRLAMDKTLYRVSIFDGDKIVAMVLAPGDFDHHRGADEILDQNKVNNRRRSRTCIPTKSGLKP